MAAIVLRVEPRRPEPQAIERAAEVLRSGGLVAFPTETVYGLGADALSERAVRDLFEVKRRPFTDPVIIHVSDATELGTVSHGLPPIAEDLALAFWPGPLTLVVPRSEAVPPIVAAGLDTVAVRSPAHNVARALIAALGRPIAAPSANRFGRKSPTRAEHVVADLGAAVDLVLDAGPCQIGVESTVVDCREVPPRVSPEQEVVQLKKDLDAMGVPYDEDGINPDLHPEIADAFKAAFGIE